MSVFHLRHVNYGPRVFGKEYPLSFLAGRTFHDTLDFAYHTSASTSVTRGLARLSLTSHLLSPAFNAWQRYQQNDLNGVPLGLHADPLGMPGKSFPLLSFRLMFVQLRSNKVCLVECTFDVER